MAKAELTQAVTPKCQLLADKLGFELVETVPDAFLLVNGQPGDRLVFERKLS